MKMHIKAKTLPVLLLGTSLVLTSGCFHDEDDDPIVMAPAVMVTYSVTVTNITNGQPLTPIGVIAHHSNYQAWQAGSAANTGLEMLAESGDPSVFLSDAAASSDVLGTVASGNGPFGPGASETVMLTTIEASDLEITVAAMLANTNDAFAGIANVLVGDLAAGDSITLLAHVYDAGTELNTETTGTMPGPAAGGEGFNAVRDDTGDFIAVHAGVVTNDDGLASSALDESHRWQGPAAKVVITRTQ